MEVNRNSAREEFVKKYRENEAEIRKINQEEIRRMVQRTTNEKITYVENYSPKDREIANRLNHSQNKRRIKKQKSKKKFKGKRVVALLCGVVAFIGGHAIMNQYTQYQQQNAPITLEQALENGESLDSLGIDSNILLEMQAIQKMLERDDLTNQEIIALAPRISGLQFDTAKTKLSNTLGVSEDEIRLYTKPIEEGQTRETVKTSNGIYTNKDIFTYENTIPSELSNYIKEIGKMQNVMKEIQRGDINRQEILEQYGKMIENTSQLAASKMNVDEKGNITVDQTKVSDLNKQSDQIKTATLKQEQNEEKEI